jgi:hypothetical protein
MSHQDAQTFSTQQQLLHHRRLATSGLTVIPMSCRHGQVLLGHLLLLQLRKDPVAQQALSVQQALPARQDRVDTRAQLALESTLKDDTLHMARLSPHNLLVLLVTHI